MADEENTNQQGVEAPNVPQPQGVSAPPVQPVPPTNPLLERARMPGETFTLPSQGIFYKNGELDPDVKDGEIYIYPMVTLDEILFKTPDKLFSGDAIADVFKRCVPSIRKPMELLAKDVDFILVALRKLTYGEEMEISYTHDCEDAKEHKYRVNVMPFIQKSKRIDPSSIAESYTLTLENGQVVKLAPVRFGDVLRIYQAASDETDDVEALKKDVIQTVSGMIESVDDITDKAMIFEWADNIKAGWVHKIGDMVNSVSDWGPEFDSVVKCKDCGKDMTVTTPVNPLAFFI